MITLIHGSFENEILNIPSGSVDLMLFDPPYKYLENQRIETEFDEALLVAQSKRVLKKNGMIAFFGRGVPMARLICLYDQAGFIHKEDMVWEKIRNSSPVLAVSRIHENFVIFGRGKSKILRSKVPYLKMKHLKWESIFQDIKRINSALNNPKSFKALQDYLVNNRVEFDREMKQNHNATAQNSLKDRDRNVHNLQMLDNGLLEKSIIRTDYLEKETTTRHNATIQSSLKQKDRSLSTIELITDGANEKSIIRTDYGIEKDTRHGTAYNNLKSLDQGVGAFNAVETGLNEKSIIRTDYANNPLITKHNATAGESIQGGDKAINCFNSIEQGMNEKSIVRTADNPDDYEKSIITVGRDHYATEHPTEKKPELMERIIKLMSQTKGITVLDPFAGTCPVGQACINLEMNYIGFEIDKDYYEIGKKRVEKLQNEKNERLF